MPARPTILILLPSVLTLTNYIIKCTISAKIGNLEEGEIILVLSRCFSLTSSSCVVVQINSL